jgi:FtsZ-interacting cell division protein ZipA
MKTRRIMVILGSVIAALLVALVFVAVWSHRQEELEKNRRQTAPARARRHEENNSASSVAVAKDEGASVPSPSTEGAEPVQDVEQGV